MMRREIIISYHVKSWHEATWLSMYVSAKPTRHWACRTRKPSIPIHSHVSAETLQLPVILKEAADLKYAGNVAQ